MYLTIILASVLAATPTLAFPSWPAPSGTNLPQCAPRVVSLATGIYLNIQGQHAELKTVITLQSLESTPTFTATLDFYVLKGELIAEIMSGQSIRAFNQAIAPPGNAAQAGLATVASVQSVELGQSQSLTGSPAVDLPILSTLNMEIVAGTQQNKYNLGKATEGCSLGFDLGPL